MSNEKGVKYDSGKPDFALLPPYFMEEWVKNLTAGSVKYSDLNWIKVTPKKRYFAAAMRHMNEYLKAVISGKDEDKFDNGEGGTGTHHLVCAASCIAFLYEHDQVWSKENNFFDHSVEADKPKAPVDEPLHFSTTIGTPSIE